MYGYDSCQEELEVRGSGARWILVGYLLVALLPCLQAAERKVVLLAVSKGVMPDSVPQGTQASLDEKAELDGVCLKVVFPKDTWFADSNLKIKDWRGYTALRFTAFNPGKKPVGLGMTIKHQGSTNYDTRVDREFALAVGKNEIDIPLTGSAKNNGTPADLSVVRILTFGCADEATILFGDFFLETKE